MLPLQSHQAEGYDDIGAHFPVLTGPLRQEFERHAERLTFDKGDKLYEEGFPCPFVPFIASGTVRVFKIIETGRELTLYRVHPGQVCVLSSTCSIADRQYTAIAEAEEPSSIYVVPGQSFRLMLRRYPALQDFILDEMSQRMLGLMSVVEEVAFWRVDYRLINRLLSETRPPQPQIINATHAQLATELGSAREVISRLLKEFERRGFVKLVRRHVEIVDREALEQYRAELQARIL